MRSAKRHQRQAFARRPMPTSRQPPPPWEQGLQRKTNWGKCLGNSQGKYGECRGGARKQCHLHGGRNQCSSHTSVPGPSRHHGTSKLCPTAKVLFPCASDIIILPASKEKTLLSMADNSPHGGTEVGGGVKIIDAHFGKKLGLNLGHALYLPDMVQTRMKPRQLQAGLEPPTVLEAASPSRRPCRRDRSTWHTPPCVAPGSP